MSQRVFPWKTTSLIRTACNHNIEDHVYERPGERDVADQRQDSTDTRQKAGIDCEDDETVDDTLALAEP